ncbi:hypothetical protein J4404_02090 [Candidatus Woesearchaeota archaeon]|nr:hypothetical protein [Candidatus Woesearchaeota archaeon]
MMLYEKIAIGIVFAIALFFITRKKETKFDKEYYDVLNSQKYKVKGQY